MIVSKQVTFPNSFLTESPIRTHLIMADADAHPVWRGVVLVLFWILTIKSHSKLPPGPLALPIVGNLPFINKYAPYKSVQEFSKTHGPVMTIYLGRTRAVFLVGYDAVKEAIVDRGEDFSGRAPIHFFNKATKGYGLAISNGERWKQIRRFTLTTLRDFGMGRKTMEAWIQEESQHLIARIESFKGNPFDPFVFNQTVSNVICCLVFGERFVYEDKQLLRIVQFFSEFIQFNSTVFGQLYNIFPWLLDHLPGRHHDMFAKVEEMKKFNMKKIEEHMKTLDSSSPRDFIDCFLLRMNQEKDDPNSEFHIDNLWTTVLNLFAAGTETTSSTIRFTLTVFMKYPEIQKRMQEEIDSVIGRERSPNMEDRKSLPFTDAVIHEVQRFLDLVPMGVPRYALKDITFRGYTIPKGTYIFAMLTSVLKEDKHWATPLMFNPQHFLDHNSNFKKNQFFMPFAAGKRACVGESLARMELFIFLVTLLQHFTFSCSEGGDSIDLTPEFSSFGNMPRRYDVVATPQ
uniref:Cytochrome P450 n=1 Tax=Neogobius melanostomus TaxID=47308 RepID=A0A8C6TBR6_9GOBI